MIKTRRSLLPKRQLPERSIAAACAVICVVGLASRDAMAAPKAQLMIVGVSHLVARHDVHNAVFADSPLSQKRQGEIASVVNHLARFRPTKVLIEAPADDPVYQQRYSAYLARAYTLPANEIYQFGFKLAKSSGISKIYPIDADGPSIIDDKSPSGQRIIEFLKSQLPGVSNPEADAFTRKSNALEASGTYLDLLRYLNADMAIRANASWYSVVTGLGRSTDNAGASYVAQWYGRNCFIFSNILSALDQGDRAVVLIGQGHEYLVRDFARLNPNIQSVDPLKYLM